jgi:hypothetical protein
MNFASDARFAKSDDSIEGAILGCGSIRCNSSSFPPPMVDQSIDGFPVPLIPTFLSHRPKRKEKKRKNPSEDVCLASSKTLGSKKSCDRKTFWSKRIPDQKPRKDDFFKKNTHTHSRNGVKPSASEKTLQTPNCYHTALSTLKLDVVTSAKDEEKKQNNPRGNGQAAHEPEGQDSSFGGIVT